MKKCFNLQNNVPSELYECVGNLKSALYKRLVIPGIILEILFVALFGVAIDSNIKFLTRPISGPPAIALQFAMLLCIYLCLPYFFVACTYSVILPYKYYKKSIGFIHSTRRFITYSIIEFLILDLLLCGGLVECYRWNYLYILNLPLVLGFSSFVLLMTIVFLYWCVRIYRCQKLRLFSWKTAEGLGLFLLVQMLAICVFALLLLVS